METEGISMDEAIIKKSYLQICTLNTKTSNYKYSELSKLLNIEEDDIEEWTIEAIQNKIIDAKIDQFNEEIIIKSHIMREIKAPEWKAIQAKIQLWKERFEAMRVVLAHTEEIRQ
jgi:translation initiation factor 3 subunit M